MKKIKIGLLALLAVFFVGCSNQAEMTKGDEQTKEPNLQFIGTAKTIEQSTTRKVGNNWSSGDEIGVFGFDSTKPMSQASVDELVNNRCFVTSGRDGVFTTKPGTPDIPLPEKGSGQDYVAYFPYKDDVLLQDFIYPIDLSDQSDIDVIDFLYSSNLKNVDESVIGRPTLEFKHQLSRMELIINPKSGSLANAKVEIKSMHTKADFGLIQEKLLVDENSVMDIVPNVVKRGNGLVVNALVLPTGKAQTFQLFITLEDGTLYKWRVPSEWKWERGYSYKKSIRLDGDAEIQEPITFFELPVMSALPSHYRFVTHELSNKNSYGANQRNYSFLYDTDHKISYWVAYPLHQYYTGSVGRVGTWRKDPKVEDMYQVDINSGITWSHLSYDRGHQIASGDRQATKEMNRQTFYATNATPQYNNLNQQIWAALEGQVRDWVSTGDTLYVVTGADFEKGKPIVKAPSKDKSIEASIPHYYYKVLAQKKNDGQYYTIGFRFENRYYNNKNFNNYRVTVKELEDETGYTFFPGLPDAAAKESIDASKWK